MTSNFTLSQKLLLAILDKRLAPHTASRITPHLNCSIQTTYKLTRRLKASGFIYKTTPLQGTSDDKTRPHEVLELTKEGRLLAIKYREERRQANRKTKRRKRR